MEATETRQRRSVIEQFTRNAVPRHEPETEEADAYKEARARGRQAVMLDIVLSDGTIESFDYALPKRITFKPDGTLILRFGKDEVRIEGPNLDRIREQVAEGRRRFIKEGTDAESDAQAEDGPHVERITIVRGEDGA